MVRKFKWFFLPKTGDLQKKKIFTEISRDFPAEIGISSGFSNFKSTKNTNLGLDLRSKAPNLLISLGHSPRLAGHNFRLGGTSSQLGRHGSGMPPRGTGSEPFLTETALYANFGGRFSGSKTKVM